HTLQPAHPPSPSSLPPRRPSNLESYDSLTSDASFYTNLKAHVDALAKQDTPYTPAVPLFLAFREALMLLKEEGLSNRIARTKRLADAARSAVEALGLRWCPDRGFGANPVPALRY